MAAKAKYFIAIIPPENISEKIEFIKKQLFEKYNLKGALRSPAHITLHRPFGWKESGENFLIEKLEQFKFGEPFSITLKNYNCFEPRVIYIDVIKNEILFNLHHQLTHFAKTQLNLFNEAEDLRGFHPHVTIAFRDLKKTRFNEIWNSLKTENFNEKFDFKGISLLKLDTKWQILKNFNI